MTPRIYSNIAVQTTLGVGIGVGDLSLTVTDATGYPVAPFAIVVDPGSATSEEVMLVTAKAGNTFTVTRAYDGTTAKAHVAGATVIHGAIADDFRGMQLGTRDVSSAAPADGNALVWNNGASRWEPGSAGATTFLGLTDTPDSYAGQGGKAVAVKADVSGLEFIAFPASGVTAVTASSPLQSSGGATPNISFLNQSANLILAGPAAGGAAAPTFRAAVKADLPAVVAYEDEANTFTAKPQRMQNALSATLDLLVNRIGIGTDIETLASLNPPFSGVWGNQAIGISEIFAARTATADSGLNVRAIGNYPASGGAIDTLAAMQYYAATHPSSLYSPGNLVGATGYSEHLAAQAITGYYGITGLLGYALNDGAGDTNVLTGLYGAIAQYGSGTTDVAYGLWIDYPGAGGTINTLYGIKVESQLDAATTAYALWTDGGETRHKAGAATVIPLVIEGDASQSANLQDWRKGATVLMEVESSGVIDFRWSMGNSTKDPATQAPADWIEVKIAGTTRYIPVYAA